MNVKSWSGLGLRSSSVQRSVALGLVGVITLFSGMGLSSLVHLNVPLVAPAYADETLQAQDIAGEWKSADDKTYEIIIAGNNVRLIIPQDHGARWTYTGTYNAQEMTLEFPVRSVQQLNDELPLTVRQAIVNNNWRYRVILRPKTRRELELVVITDTVTYGRDNHRVKSFNRDASRDTVALAKPASYTIGNVRLNFQPFQRRIRAQISQLESQIQRIDSEIATVNRDIQRVEQEYARWGRSLETAQGHADVAQARIEALEQEIIQFNTQLRQQLEQVAPTLRQSRSSLLNDIQVYEAEILRRQDGIASPPDVPELVKQQPTHRLIERLDSAKEQLAAVEQRIHQLAPMAALRDFAADKKGAIRTAVSERNSRLREVLRYNALIQPVKNRLEELVKTVEDKKGNKRRLQRQIAYLQQEPSITEIISQAGGDEKYKATLGPDERILNGYREALRVIDTSIRDRETQAAEAERMMNQANVQRRRHREAMLEVADEAIATTDELSEEIWENALIRYGVELGFSTVQVLTSGGWVGAVLELGSKMIEYYAINGASLEVPTSFDGDYTALSEGAGSMPNAAFDESAMRRHYQQVYEENQNNPDFDPRELPAESYRMPSLLDGLDSEGLTKEALVVLTNSSKEFLTEPHRAELSRRFERTAAQNSINRGMTGLANADLERVGRQLPGLERSFQEAAAAEQRLAEAYRRARGSGNTQIQEQIYREWQSKRRQTRQARDAMHDAFRRFGNGTALTRGSRRALTSADRAARIQDNLRKVTEGRGKLRELRNANWRSFANFTRVGVNIGAGIAIDGIKSGINNYLNEQEAGLWREHFRLDLALRVAVKNFMEASNTYWEACDHHKTLVDELDLLYDQRMRVDGLFQAYTRSSDGNQGFYVEKNEPFSTADLPLRFSVKVMGPANGEYLRLENPRSIYRYAQSQPMSVLRQRPRVPTSQPPEAEGQGGTTSSSPSTPTPTEGQAPSETALSQPRDQVMRYHQIISIDGAEPPADGGPLPLSIHVE